MYKGNTGSLSVHYPLTENQHPTEKLLFCNSSEGVKPFLALTICSPIPDGVNHYYNDLMEMLLKLDHADYRVGHHFLPP